MDTEDDVAGYPGQGLGRPETGPGSLAMPGRRMLGLLVDWLMCLLIVHGFGRALGYDVTGGGTDALLPLAVLLLENALLLPSAGATVGQRLTGVATERLDGGRLDLGAAALRSLLLVLFVPVITLIWQRDLRGAHDIASGAVVVRTR